MKIVSIKKGVYEEILTDEPHLNLYRRMEPGIWEHFLGVNHGWLEYRFTEFLDEAYDKFMKEHGERNSDNITSA